MEKEIERDTKITLSEGNYSISWHDPDGYPLTISKVGDNDYTNPWAHEIDGTGLTSLQRLITKFFEEIDAPNTPPRS